MNGHIYFLTNRSMPNLVKIGYTIAGVDERIKQLNSTGVPSSFELAACFLVSEPAKVEEQIHNLLCGHRFAENREFFVGPLSALLGVALPVLLTALRTHAAESQEIAGPKPHSLDERSAVLLQFLVGSKKNIGYSAYEFTGELRESELEIENRFAKLKKLGLVAERRSRQDWEGTLWRITTEGIEFLFDHGLVTDCG